MNQIPFLENSEGFKLPSLGLGTWQLRNDELKFAMNLAFENGCRYFDTSYSYQNEEKLGEIILDWIKSRKIKRNELFVSTKLPNFVRQPTQVRSSFLKQLNKLKLDYVDLYFMHLPIGIKFAHYLKTNEVELDEHTNIVLIWKELEKLVQEGKIKYLGLSNVDQPYIERIITNCTIKPSNIQLESHPFYPQTELIEYCKKTDCVVTAICPLGSPGFNRYLTENNLTPELLPPVLFDWQIRSIGEKYNKSAAQVLLRFSLQRGLAVIPKSAKEKHIKENMDIFDFALSKDDMHSLNTIHTTIIKQVLRNKDMVPLPIITRFEIEVGTNLHENKNLAADVNANPSADRMECSRQEQGSSTETEKDKYFTVQYRLNRGAKNLSVEIASPNIVIIRGIQSPGPNMPPEPFQKTFLLSAKYSIHDIVSNVSPAGIMTVTTQPWPIKGCREIPIYWNEDP